MKLEIPNQEHLAILSPQKLRALVKKASLAVNRTTNAAEIVKLSSMLDAAESLMHAAGMYQPDEIREVVEARMRARWKLGQLLAKMERGHGPGRGKKKDHIGPSFLAYIKSINLDKKLAITVQRLGTLPLKELESAFRRAEEQEVLCTIAGLITLARPYWYKANRQARHKRIADAAKSAGTNEIVGPFPLIYADPPWKFEIYSEKGLERTPDQHYPTMTDEEIINFKINGKPVQKITNKDAALLMWCTSSNLIRALEVMKGWGFTYKTHAVWDKEKAGLGLVFRNQHEVLLYGTRGNMPGPQYQPKSIFRFPRGRHSAKPPEIRKEIEKMYPDFDAQTRLELFARDQIDGWTCYGNEAFNKAA